MGKVLVLVTVLAACGVEEADRALSAVPACAELGAPALVFCEPDGTCSSLACDTEGFCTWNGATCFDRAELAVTWSMVGDSDSRGVPDPVQCTETISHPCPFLLYTRTLVLEHTRATWKDATGGVDEAGVQAEDRLPWIDDVSFENGELVIPERGDDGGLRRLATLQQTPTGYEGDVAWTLFTVAGTTTFHVELTRK